MPAPGLGARELSGPSARARAPARGGRRRRRSSLIPAVICAVRGIWVPTCDWWFGIKAYLAMPLADARCSAGGVLGPRDRRSRRRVARALTPARSAIAARCSRCARAGSCARCCSRCGGSTRRRRCSRTTRCSATSRATSTTRTSSSARPLVWSRLEQLLWVVAVLALVAIAARRAARMRVRARATAGRRRGSARSRSRVRAAAGAARAARRTAARSATRSTPRTSRTCSAAASRPTHFIIHYAQTPEIEEDIALIAADHEFRYAQVVAQLGVAPRASCARSTSPTAIRRARWIGARDVEMAKPWRREIYLDHRAFPHGSLRHEIAHAVASEFGDPLFGVAARRVLGLPVAGQSRA